MSGAIASPLDSPSQPEDKITLSQRAYRIRRNALMMGEVQGQGYIGQALGIADVLAVSYFHALNYRADDPEWEGRDRFLLSIGHYAIALYATLIEAGVLSPSHIEEYGMDDSRLPMSGMAAYTPGMEITGGSLGHGLSIAIGICLGLKRKQYLSAVGRSTEPAREPENFVYNLLSDGELGEGSTWEAAMSAAHHQLDNLIALVDFNNQQADGPSTQMLSSEPLEDKWRAFGWHTQRVDGNDLDAVRKAFDLARNWTEPQPRVIIFNTKMCKGVPFLEEREITHFVRVEPDEWEKALAVLDDSRPLVARGAGGRNLPPEGRG